MYLINKINKRAEQRWSERVEYEMAKIKEIDWWLADSQIALDNAKNKRELARSNRVTQYLQRRHELDMNQMIYGIPKRELYAIKYWLPQPYAKRRNVWGLHRMPALHPYSKWFPNPKRIAQQHKSKLGRIRHGRKGSASQHGDASGLDIFDIIYC